MPILAFVMSYRADYKTSQTYICICRVKYHYRKTEIIHNLLSTQLIYSKSNTFERHVSNDWSLVWEDWWHTETYEKLFAKIVNM